MRRVDLIARLKNAEPVLKQLGIASLYLFGSHAREDASETSDVDVFVDPVPNRPFGFLPFMNAYEVIEDAVGLPVDYGTRTGLHPLLRAAIERDAIRVF